METDLENLTAYCLRCKLSVSPKNPALATTKNGRRCLVGTCPRCYTKLSKLLPKTS